MSQTIDNNSQLTKNNRFSNKISDYELITLIGVGSFGRVYRARHKTSNPNANLYEYCAVKRIAKKCSPNVGKIFTEVSIHLRLKHDNILELYNVIEDEQYVYLVLELCSGGTIAQLLKLMAETRKLNSINHKNGNTSDATARGIKRPIISHIMIRNIIRQLCSALDYLHRHSIVHRDLNLNNILLLSPFDGNNVDQIVIKIADFGLAIDINSSNANNLCTKAGIDERNAIPMPFGTTICGTPGFISPEVWSRIRAVSSKSDVFSLGSILFSLISGYTPKGKLDLSTFPPFAADLICRLLAPEPETRPSIEEIIKHPYIIGPFKTDRLLPINKLTKTLQLSISDDGRVTLNFLKRRISIDISKDGENICIKTQNDSNNYAFDSLPSTHWKKYMYAFRFVDLVKAKTPKISIYCKNESFSNKIILKCSLMENNEFEATILDIVSNELSKVLFDEFDAINDTNLSKQLIYLRNQCIEIEKQLNNIKNISGIDWFPACFGHKTRYKALKDNELVSVQRSVNCSQILRSVNINGINGIGVVSQLSNGVIRVTFTDKCAICVACNSQITFWTSNGDEKKYNKHDSLPEYVKEKLALLPHAIQQLRHSICSNNHGFMTQC